MLDELNRAIEDYLKKWQKLVAERTNKQFFEKLRPTAVGWKVADTTEYERLYAELKPHCDRTVETWMNGRWIAKMHLRETKLTTGIEIIKLMQRRPASTDAVGLDHLDFYSLDVAQAEEILQQESGLKWTRESNDVIQGYEWLSVWFEGTEAKLKADTVLDIVVAELTEINKRITEVS